MSHGKLLVIGFAFFGLTWGMAQDEVEESEIQDSREAVREEAIGGAPPAPEAACFNVRRVDSFDAISDEHVYVAARGGEHYLLTMERSCTGLRNAEQIAIANQIARVCSNSLAEITYRGIGGRLETCWIRQVEGVEDRAAAEYVVRRRAQQE